MTLLEEIDAYLARNNISKSAFTMRVLFNTSSYSNLKKGNLSQPSQDRLREFMADYPDADGIAKTRIKSSEKVRAKSREKERLANKSQSRSLSRVENRIDVSNLRTVSRDPCTICGARGDYSCGHHQSNHWAVLNRSSLPKRIAG